MPIHPPFLDLTQAKEIAADDDMLRELVQTFVDSLDVELVKTQTAFRDQDTQQVHFSLHALKGFLPLFCKPDLAQAVVALYQNCREQELAQTQAAYQALEPAFLELLKEVRAWLGAL
jgi:HPt (histidine-containing phosphotransfer) domain-containing protein